MFGELRDVHMVAKYPTISGSLARIAESEWRNNMAIFTIIGIASVGGAITGILWKIIDIIKEEK